ncbi:MAG: hypothetical protein JOZ53_07465 [Planctomycetaceae bacterium]|nr:hypothetical protein [Planctomycetaceae bacterium]
MRPISIVLKPPGASYRPWSPRLSCEALGRIVDPRWLDGSADRVEAGRDV